MVKKKCKHILYLFTYYISILLLTCNLWNVIRFLPFVAVHIEWQGLVRKVIHYNKSPLYPPCVSTLSLENDFPTQEMGSPVYSLASGFVGLH